MEVGRIFGIKIIFNWFFFFFLFIYALMGRLAETIILFSVVLLHEFFHILVARGYGLTVREVELYPFGGMARIDDLLEYDPGVESRVALAGPLFNLFLVGLAIIFYVNFSLSPAYIMFFIRCNLLVAFFNLLPSLPLDGGRILRAMLSRRMGYRKATDRAVLLGKFMALCLLAGGIITACLGMLNPSFIIVAFFMFFAAQKEQSMASYVFVRYLNRKKGELHREGIMKAGYLVAVENTPLREVVKNFTPRNYYLIKVVSPGFKVKGTVTEGQVIDAVMKRGVHLPIKRLLP
ncbi:MAG: peptidase M50 [Candidatus Syntrophonatronum acetioxidans]|uniref:Peptidase M50 n=1 Tax=Candidatus Syntrophonatronum acetioxidans TaxID=1795816 RepID=A0A424YIG1_9FIRM|nr:MAG: peptidase M50 [Candidatus Syntrophonatronum acetioxidans]